MILRVCFILFLLFSFLDAKEYPTSYKQLGTPLYKSAEAFVKYKDNANLHEQILAYIDKASKSLETGLNVDSSVSKKDKKIYLKELRDLQNSYDKLLHALHESIDLSIKKDDYELFLKLTSYAFDGLFSNSNNRNRAIAFYSKHKHKSNCPVLDKQMGDAKLINETLELFKAEIIKSSYSSKSKKTSNKKVRIVAKRESNRISIIFENRNIYPVTIKVKQIYKNIKPLEKRENEIVLQGKSSLKYAVLEVENSNAYYSYSFSWIMGSKDAKHDDDFVYRLPFKKETAHIVSQGYNGKKTHKGSSAYAIDFPMPEGTKIHAARGGLVVKTKSNSNVGGYDKKYASSGNYVRVLHSDGTMATYYHLKHKGVLVSVGDSVSKGSALGYSGNTGYSSGPHLHFSVFKATASLKNQTIPVKIISKEELIEGPKVGKHYTAK